MKKISALLMGLVLLGMAQAASAIVITVNYYWTGDTTSWGTSSETFKDGYYVSLATATGNLISGKNYGVGVDAIGDSTDQFIDAGTSEKIVVDRTFGLSDPADDMLLIAFSIKDSLGNTYNIGQDTIFSTLLAGTNQISMADGTIVGLAPTDMTLDGSAIDTVNYYTFSSLYGSYSITSLTFTKDDPTVPEPATLSLIGLGLSGLGLIRRRRSA